MVDREKPRETGTDHDFLRIELAKNYRYTRKQLKEIEFLIEAHYDELVGAWRKHFGS